MGSRRRRGSRSRRPSGARSTGCSTGPAQGPAAGCLRSAPAGAELPSAPRRGAPPGGPPRSPGGGCRLLEIGTGWGDLAIRAARRGATVRTVTISREQQELATRRVAEAGLAGRVNVELRDYRDIEGRFDAI